MKMLPGDAFIDAIITSHALDASFQWQQRERASTAPNYTLSELSGLDTMLQSNLDGLHRAGKLGFDHYREFLDNDDGDAFTLAAVAARIDMSLLEDVIDSLEDEADDPDIRDGLIAALAWLPFQKASPIIDRWKSSADIVRRSIAIGAAIRQRYDPGTCLAEAALSEDAGLRSLALRGAGELGRVDLQLHLQRGFKDPDSECRYQARRSALLFRLPGVAGSLIEPMLSGGTRSDDACRLAMYYLPPDASHELQQNLSGQDKTVRFAVIGAGATGDPRYLPWLLQVIEHADYARVAMDAIISITGVNLEDENLEGSAPAGFEEGPTDDPDDSDVEVPDDDDIEWPDPTAVQAWWQDHGRHRFEVGTRYLYGEKRDRAGLRTVLMRGNQRVRTIAAFELAQTHRERLNTFNTFDTTAPARRQRIVMANNGLIGLG